MNSPASPKPLPLMKILLPMLILGVAGAGMWLLIATKPEAKPVETTEKAWLVSVREVKIQSLSPQLTLYGRVESPRDTVLKAAVSADVLAVPGREGDAAPTETLLIQLDDREAALAVAQREAELSEIEADIQSERNQHQGNIATLVHEKELLALTRRSSERLQRLKSNKATSQSQLDDALQATERQAIAVKQKQLALTDHGARLARLKARMTRAKANLDQAALDLERTMVKAPYSARISEILVSPGDRVRPGDSLVSLYDPNALEVRAQIPNRYEAIVRRGLGSSDRLLASADRNTGTLQMELDRLSSRERDNSGGFDALFKVTEGRDTLRIGSFISMNLQLPAENGVIAVPWEALYGLDRAYKLEDGRMRTVRVERIGDWSGPDGKAYSLVRSRELKAGDQLIISQLPNAIDGLRVDIAGEQP